VCQAHQRFQVAAELLAPPALDLEAINLSGLTDQSVSAEVIQPGDVLDVTMITDYAKLGQRQRRARGGRWNDVGSVVGRLSVGGMEIEQAEQAVNAESIARACSAIPASR